MKNWFRKYQSILSVSVISVLTAFVYRNSFTSPFFQDDKFHLSLVARGNPWEIIPNFPYRPISIQFFYTLGHILFNNNVFGYHLILFLAFVITLWFIYKISQYFFDNPLKVFVSTFIYALNVSIFANFYWIAVSYFVFAALFIFSALYFYLRNKKKSAISIALFILALLSNEIALIFPVILVAYWFFYRDQKLIKAIPYFVLSMIFLIFRYTVVGLPKSSDYQIVVNLQIFETLRWYFLRGSNLPEGVNRSQGFSILLMWTLNMGILVFSMVRSKFQEFKMALFSIIWFVIGALPFFFLPNHMSSYYLTISLLGVSMFISNYLENKKLIVIFCLTYLLLTIFGLNFLSQTHWIILKNTGPIGKF